MILPKWQNFAKPGHTAFEPLQSWQPESIKDRRNIRARQILSNRNT